MKRLLTLSLLVVAVLGCGGGTVTVGGAGGGAANVGGGDGVTGGGDGATGGGDASTGGGAGATGGGTATTGGGSGSTGGGAAHTGGGTGSTGGGSGATGGGTAHTGGGSGTTGGGTGSTGGGSGSTGGGSGSTGGGTGTTGGGSGTTGGGTGTTGGGSGATGGGSGTTGGGTGSTGGGTGSTGGGTGAGCSTTELLVNGAFDDLPRATGWTEYSISSTYPIVSDDSGPIGPQSGDYRAWLGSWVATTNGSTITDAITQNVTIPANTTVLRVTGYWSVDSYESTFATTEYDYAGLLLLHPDGGRIAYPVYLSNLDQDTTWTAFDYAIDGGFSSGESVQLLMGSTNDDGYPTSFFFDTLSLKATHCP